MWVSGSVSSLLRAGGLGGQACSHFVLLPQSPDLILLLHGLLELQADVLRANLIQALVHFQIVELPFHFVVRGFDCLELADGYDSVRVVIYGRLG